jgi:hypothetical protein
MSKDLNPNKAFIFRIIHKGTLPRILADGCHCHSTAHSGYVEIGNQELIGKRHTRLVTCAPGGTLSDYVPVLFHPSPQDGSGGRDQGNAEGSSDRHHGAFPFR